MEEVEELRLSSIQQEASLHSPTGLPLISLLSHPVARRIFALVKAAMAGLSLRVKAALKKPLLTLARPTPAFRCHTASRLRLLKRLSFTGGRAEDVAGKLIVLEASSKRACGVTSSKSMISSSSNRSGLGRTWRKALVTS